MFAELNVQSCHVLNLRLNLQFLMQLTITVTNLLQQNGTNFRTGSKTCVDPAEWGPHWTLRAPQNSGP